MRLPRLRGPRVSVPRDTGAMRVTLGPGVVSTGGGLAFVVGHEPTRCPECGKPDGWHTMECKGPPRLAARERLARVPGETVAPPPSWPTKPGMRWAKLSNGWAEVPLDYTPRWRRPTAAVLRYNAERRWRGYYQEALAKLDADIPTWEARVDAPDVEGTLDTSLVKLTLALERWEARLG